MRRRTAWLSRPATPPGQDRPAPPRDASVPAGHHASVWPPQRENSSLTGSLHRVADRETEAAPPKLRPGESPKLTARGAATRDRILHVAAELMFVRGVAATVLEEVRVASNVSKSQLYNHFPDKESLVRAVVAMRGKDLLEHQRQQLARLNSFRGLERWCDSILKRNTLRGGAYGCEIGSLASELSDTDEQARIMLAEHFRSWEELLAAGLARMRKNGLLRPETDPDTVAVAVMVAVQGGYLLAQTAHSSQPMAIALDMALNQVRSYAADNATGVASPS
jgi:TetR/AcrR family transcriptional repressor of nem operon